MDLRSEPDLSYRILFWMTDEELRSAHAEYSEMRGKGKIRTAKEVVGLIDREVMQRRALPPIGDAIERSTY